MTGEFLVLKRKDKEFNKELKKKGGIDKVKYVFDRLFNFNKELFGDAKKTVQSIDKESVQKKFQEGKDRVEGETRKKVSQAADKVKETADKVKKKAEDK